MIDSILLDLLVCPVSGCRLEYNADDEELISKGAWLAFPIRDGIPVMVVSEARKINETPVEEETLRI